MNEAWANAYANSKHPNVPSITMGGGATANGASAVQDLATMQMMEMARRMNVDLNTGNN